MYITLKAKMEVERLKEYKVLWWNDHTQEYTISILNEEGLELLRNNVYILEVIQI